MRTLYIASTWANRDQVIAQSDKLAYVGIRAVQTWVNLTVPDAELTPNKRREISQQELFEIRQADAFLLMTEGCQKVSGGMHFEAGWALALGKPVYLLGPEVNIFCSLMRPYACLLCDHHWTVSSPIDSLEVCSHCGDRQDCANADRNL